MATRRHYTAEFKLEVINMVIDQGIGISKLSKDLSISDNLIRRWVKQYQLEQNGSVLQGTIPLTPDQQRIRELERENQALKSDVELLKKSVSLLCKNHQVSPIQLVKALHKEADSVSRCCRLLDVKRNSYYKSMRCIKATDTALILKVKACFNQHKQRYSRRRLKAALFTEYGIDISSRRLGRLMKEQQLITVWQGRKYRRARQSPECATYPNKLDRQFACKQANSTWVSDITYIWTQEGWLYLAAVMDLYSRKIVGFVTSNSPNADLVCRALQMAISVRQPPAGLMIHSDQGCQYTSKLYQALVDKYQLTGSMSRNRNCWDRSDGAFLQKPETGTDLATLL